MTQVSTSRGTITLIISLRDYVMGSHYHARCVFEAQLQELRASVDTLQVGNSTSCVTPSTANAVFRLGLYEYSYIYRSSPQSLLASTGSYGVYIAELAQNIRDRISGASPIIYKHNVAHDGSLAMLLSILQVDVMIWPGLGAELVFEIYSKSGVRFVRILWGGGLFKSSNPALGLVDMLPLDTLLGYFDGLVGVSASKVPGLCSNTG